MDSTNRFTLRQKYRALRQGLSEAEQQAASSELVDICIQQADFQQADSVAMYLANDGEIDLSPLIEYCWQHKKQVFLPVLHPFSKGHLLFIHYTRDSLMRANCYGIAEPKPNCKDVTPLANLDVIFTPLVAFDVQGNRLGMGGGFYDRTLAPIHRDKLKAQVIGLAHQCQLTELLPHEKWDIPLKKIITPQQVFNCVCEA